MELQLQVTEEELLEFPEVRHDQITTSHTDNPGGEVVLSTEKSTLQNSSRSCGEAVMQIRLLRLKSKNHTIGDQ